MTFLKSECLCLEPLFTWNRVCSLISRCTLCQNVTPSSKRQTGSKQDEPDREACLMLSCTDHFHFEPTACSAPGPNMSRKHSTKTTTTKRKKEDDQLVAGEAAQNCSGWGSSLIFQKIWEMRGCWTKVIFRHVGLSCVSHQESTSFRGTVTPIRSEREFPKNSISF